MQRDRASNVRQNATAHTVVKLDRDVTRPRSIGRAFFESSPRERGKIAGLDGERAAETTRGGRGRPSGGNTEARPLTFRCPRADASAAVIEGGEIRGGGGGVWAIADGADTSV